MLWGNAAEEANLGITDPKKKYHVNGVMGKPVLHNVPFYDSHKDSPLDIMHLVRNLAYHLSELLRGKRKAKVKKGKLTRRKKESTNNSDGIQRCTNSYNVVRISYNVVRILYNAVRSFYNVV